MGEIDGDNWPDYVSEFIDLDPGHSGLLMPKIEGQKSKVIKDFILFDIQVIGLGIDSGRYGCGIEWQIDAVGIRETFDPFMDELVEYAKEVRKEVYDKDDENWESNYRHYANKTEKNIPNVGFVQFMLLADYSCHRCSWEYDEYDCEIDIVGRIDRQDFCEMLYKIGKREEEKHEKEKENQQRGFKASEG